MSEEMRVHLEMATEANLAAGMSPTEARYAARREFGGVEQVKENYRDQRGIRWLEETGRNLNYAVRQLAKSPGFTAVVVLTLALGIGATTAIYSVVDTVLLNPIPGPNADRLVQIGQWIQLTNQPTADRAGLSPPALEAIEANRDFFAELTWCDGLQLERKGDDFATTAFGVAVPVNFFPLLGAQPLIGRIFTPSEAVAIEQRVPVKDTVIVLSYSWWRSEFAGDRNVLGRIVELGGRRFTIIGVMPEYFQFPSGGAGTQYWLPADPARTNPLTLSAPNIRLIARLKPGVTEQQAQAMLDTVAQRLLKDHPDNDRSYGEYWRQTRAGLRFWCQPLRDAIQGRTYAVGFDEIRQTLWGFFAAIGFVLAIVCANVANLALARTERRQHELAVRAALGAGRGRLMRQLLTENLLLASLGGLAGLVVTAWALKPLAAFATMPRLRPIEMDAHVLGIALLVSLLTGLIFGLAPAWRAGRTRINETLTQGAMGATTGLRGSRFRSALVVVQVALAVVLLTGAGLMIQSVVRLLRVDPGFDPSNLISVGLRLPSRAGPNGGETRNALVARLHERFTALPGVSAVGFFQNNFSQEKIAPEGQPAPRLVDGSNCGWESSDFFRAARIPLLGGRHFERGDIGENVRTVIVNETFARLCWPGDNAVGKKFRALQQRGEPTYEVVGVVGDVRVYRLDETLRPTYYRPYPAASLTGAADTFVIRTQQDPGSLIPAIRAELKAAYPELRMPYIGIYRQELYDATNAQRTYRNYLAVFAGAGLLLSAIGIYGVLAYSVVRRTRELGIRMALGAERRHVMRLVIGEGARLIGAGVVVGLVASFWLTQFLRQQLFEVSPNDPVVLSAVVVVLSAVALVACWLPARRATKVDPVVALRAE